MRALLSMAELLVGQPRAADTVYVCVMDGGGAGYGETSSNLEILLLGRKAQEQLRVWTNLPDSFPAHLEIAETQVELQRICLLVSRKSSCHTRTLIPQLCSPAQRIWRLWPSHRLTKK